MPPEKVVILGSGLAGWTAAIYAARSNLSPLLYAGALTDENLVRRNLPFGQLNYENDVQNFPGYPDGIAGYELLLRAKQQAERFGTRVITEDIVRVDVSTQPFSLLGSDDRIQTAHSLIIATGSRTRPWPFGFEYYGVTMVGGDDFALPRFRSHPFAIIGGGDTALTNALYASHFASHVFIVHRQKALHATPYYVAKVNANPMIEVLSAREIVGVVGVKEVGISGIRVRRIKDGQEEILPVRGINPCLGTIPNSDFLFNQLALNNDGSIRLISPPSTQTSVAGVFAAGDVADRIYRQAITAAEMGCKAALDAERWLAAMGIH